jgi:magnesium-transporting ATPase (P-type)
LSDIRVISDATRRQIRGDDGSLERELRGDGTIDAFGAQELLLARSVESAVVFIGTQLRTVSLVSMQTYWSTPPEDLLKALETSAAGLSTIEAERRFARVGENRLARQEGKQTLHLLLRQLSSPRVLILIFGAVISIAAEQWTDATIILAIVIGSALLRLV